MYCYNCGKEIDSEAKYCKYCGTQIDKEEVQENLQDDVNSKTNETVNNKNIITGIVAVVCIVILYCIAFSPVKFDIPIMGVSVEATVSYDFAMQKAKFRIGAFGFDKDNVSPIDFINMKLNLINHTLFNSDISPNLTQTINTQTQARKTENSPWYDRALIEYYSIENKKKHFLIDNLFKSNIEKEEHFSDIVKQLEISAENVSNAYYNANLMINEEYVRKYVKDFNKLGFNIASAEGDYYFTPYYPCLIQTVGIPKVWKEYLEMTVARQNDFGEAYCKLKINDLVDVIIRYDKFMQEHPKFTHNNLVKEEQNRYLYSYLHGFDNGSIFDYETNKIKDDYKQSIEKFLKEHTDFSRYSLVNEYYNKLKKNNYRINDNIGNWLWTQIFD